MNPRVVVSAGGGGVGKTTTSAALALALARQGAKVLVVTVDPARRLADALGVKVGAAVQPVTTLGPHTFDALMPDPALSSSEFLDILFADIPKAKERVAKNIVYGALSVGLAGMHEVVSLMLIARAVEARAYDWVVIDTAPSRYALDFVGYPGRLASMLEGPALAWFASLAPSAKSQSLKDAPGRGGLLAWGMRRAEGLVAKVLGEVTAEAITELFSDMASARERFATLARKSEELLLGARTRYLVVTAPTGAALADASFLAKHLAGLGKTPSAVVLNRADNVVPAWLLEAHGRRAEGSSEVAASLDALLAEKKALVLAADAAEIELAHVLPAVPLMRVDTVAAARPDRVVAALADHLGTALAAIGGLPTLPPPPPSAHR